MFKSQKQDESGCVSTDQVVGYFKGIIEIESKDDKVKYRRLKKELIEDLIEKLKFISK
jgi:hypothetical protein